MKTNDKGIKLIKEFEGLRLQAYQDSVGVWTIGYGHTASAGSPRPVSGMRITESEAEEILRRDLNQYEDAVTSSVKVPLSSNQFSALVSFTFNLGAGNLRSSTLLRKLNAGDYLGAAHEFSRWNKAGGKVLAGLTRRREAEQILFITDAGKDAKPVAPSHYTSVFGWFSSLFARKK